MLMFYSYFYSFLLLASQLANVDTQKEAILEVLRNRKLPVGSGKPSIVTDIDALTYISELVIEGYAVDHNSPNHY